MDTSIDIYTEQIDDVPLLFGLLQKMGLQPIVDAIIKPHGNRQGLSVGWMIVVWLIHILTEKTHCMDVVREWVPQLQETLERLSGQEIEELDFTDDRLADILRYLSDDAAWHRLETQWSRHLIRVYDLRGNRVRLDGTSASVYHDEKTHVLFRRGRSKDGQWDVQFRVMLGSLDPLGMPLAVDVVAGNRAEDPLYVPNYRRIKDTVQRDGLLYIGDSKMSALETRAVIAGGNDYYLTPLAMVGETPELLASWLEPVWEGDQDLTPIFLPEDLPEDGQAPDPKLAIAEGFVISRSQAATVDGEQIEWDERCLVIRSKAHAEAQIAAFQGRVDKAETALRALTPTPGRGKRQIRDETTLVTKVQAIVDKYRVDGLFDIDYERQVSRRDVRAYGDKPARTEETVRYQITVGRRSAAIEQVERTLGWRVYVTNAPADELTLTDAVLAYRDQYLVERIFARLKGRRLSILPLYVQRDDHALGLIRLLTLAVRLMALADYSAQRALADEGTELAGVYAGNPKRSTARPTLERMLRVFQRITLTVVTLPERVVRHVTPLTAVQERILALLGLSPTLYTSLATA
ncbi:MAG: DUF4277 domain-containing protein [Anaerolineae bacterium]